MQYLPRFFVLLCVLVLSACASVELKPRVVEPTSETIKTVPPKVEPARNTQNNAPLPTAKKPNDLACHQKAQAHIALILPLKAASFAQMAKVLQQGFQAAYDNERKSSNTKTLPIKSYALADEDINISATYKQALSQGACAVVGPMTRDGVAALVKQNKISVPTLTLNNLETNAAGPVFGFGLSVENEAKQIARLMNSQAINDVILVNQGSSLARRVERAFEEEWQRLGGSVTNKITFAGDKTAFSGISPSPNTAFFLAADANKAGLIRSYLPKNIAVYGTSVLFNGDRSAMASYDLDGVTFIDMPWLLQPDHPAVMIYPRANANLPVTQDRFYALGIDAYRLISLILQDDLPTDRDAVLDGVTGQIYLTGNNFERQAAPARFAQGELKTLNNEDAAQ